jgi:hypothetical protein
MKRNISAKLNKKSKGKEIICIVEIAAIQREIYSVTKLRLNNFSQLFLTGFLIYIVIAVCEQFEYMNFEFGMQLRLGTVVKI